MSAKSKVYLCRTRDGKPGEWPAAVARLLDAARPLGFVRRRDRVAIKVHVGEPGLATRIPPEAAAVVAGRLRELGAHPYYTDTAVLYTGPRSHGPGHAEVAARHGFTLERAGAVFLPADGVAGNLEVPVAIAGRHYQKVGVAEGIAGANAAVIVSHATGHLVAGFGATLKNMGMGCASRKGKLAQHSDTRPAVAAAECVACGDCVPHCPSGALTQPAGEPARIDEGTCIGCGECLAHCCVDAIHFQWDASSQTLQEKMVEHALGAARALGGRYTCLQAIVNLTRHCDCWAAGSPRVAADIGFALSDDPVALDQATLDLVAAQAGQRLDQLSFPKLDGRVQLAYAEELGLGTRAHELIEIPA